MLVIIATRIGYPDEIAIRGVVVGVSVHRKNSTIVNRSWTKFNVYENKRKSLAFIYNPSNFRLLLGI